MVRHVDLVMESRETNKPNGMTDRENRHRWRIIQGVICVDAVQRETDTVNTLPSAGRNSTGFFSCLVPVTVPHLDQGHPERP